MSRNRTLQILDMARQKARKDDANTVPAPAPSPCSLFSLRPDNLGFDIGSSTPNKPTAFITPIKRSPLDARTEEESSPFNYEERISDDESSISGSEWSPSETESSESSSEYESEQGNVANCKENDGQGPANPNKGDSVEITTKQGSTAPPIPLSTLLLNVPPSLIQHLDKKLADTKIKRKIDFDFGISTGETADEKTSEKKDTAQPIEISSLETKKLEGKKEEGQIEREINTEEDQDDVTLSVSLKRVLCDDNIKKRVYDKLHCCIYCGIQIFKITRHLSLKHAEEVAVAELLCLPTKNKKRNDGFQVIIREGDFYHNSQVLFSKSGELKLARRPTPLEQKLYTYEDYGPCPYCLGFLLRVNLWRHIKESCPALDDGLKKGNIDGSQSYEDLRSESDALLGLFKNETKEFNFKTDIVTKIIKDEIGKVCTEDELILQVGSMLYAKFNKSQAHLIRSTMRLLARVLIEMKRLDKNISCLSNCISPSRFDTLIQAVKIIGQSRKRGNDRDMFEKASLVLKLGPALKKAASMERGMALRETESDPGLAKTVNSKIKAFLALMNAEWELRLTSTAIANVQEKKFNSEELLPLTQDLWQLKESLSKTLKESSKRLEENVTYENWRKLAEAALSSLLLFNKRRSGETSKMKVAQFLKRPNWDNQSTDELKKTFTALELHLAKNLALVEVRGKRGKKVPVLITPAVQEAVELLIKTRNDVGIHQENPFIFAVKNSVDSYLRGYTCLRNQCNKALLKSPEHITGTKLRKYVATVCQVFNLTENETDWLADHMGHDIRTHRKYYRLQEGARELTKVSRILLAVEQGASNFAGKKLEEIDFKNTTLEDLPPFEVDNLEENVSEILENEKKNDVSVGDQLQTSDQDLSKPGSSTSNVPTKPLTTKNDSEETNESEELDGKEVFRQTGKRKFAQRHIPWSADEKTALISYFQVNIRKNKPIQKDVIEACQEKNPILASRPWRAIKDYYRYYLKTLESKRLKHVQ